MFRLLKLTAICAGLTIVTAPVLAQDTLGPSGEGVNNALNHAVAWKQTAAEYRALYHQGFNVARMHVQTALHNRKDGDRPLAIVTDMDDTVLLPLTYWGHLINQNKDFFDDPIWDAWVPQNKVLPAPGALEFLKFCEENGVEVFYITAREQGENTYDYAMGHLRHLGFPFADDDHLTVLRDTSNKETKQDEIMQTHDVIVFLGDNINDFRRKYYLKSDIDGRIAAMEADRDMFGSKYILFPNPTDGHWLAAIFGESEPPASDENRMTLKAAATREAWEGIAN